MTYAYTPGLKRKKATIVRKIRRLPVPGEILVNVGDNVAADELVAKTTVLGDAHVINVADILGLETPDEVKRHMLRGIGDVVEENEVIARSPGFLGLFSKLCRCCACGTVEHIAEVTGQVIIRELPTMVEVSAYIPGKVVEVMEKEGATIETNAAFIQGIFGIGGETHGEIMVLADSRDDVLTPELIGPECAGKVIVGGALVKGDALRKAVEMGVTGVIVGGILGSDLKDFLGYEIGVAITGHEETSLTIVVTEGFGKMKMSDKTFELLKLFNGKQVCLNGATQIRAGVIRPEIIIPTEEPDLAKFRGEEEETLAEALDIGSLVRIIRQPHFGATGRVIDLPVDLQLIETGSKVRVLEVELEDGRSVIVPRANVEIIVE